jgi:RNA polymerase sigma factor, sigma-70 family
MGSQARGYLTSDARKDSLAIVDDDRPSFESMMPAYYGALLRRLVFVLGNEDDARDVAQDAYLQAFHAWGRFVGGDPRAWLYTIALRLAFNRLRARKRWFAPLRPVEAAVWDAPSDPDLWAALMSLDPRHRSAFLLNVQDGFTQLEIARMMSVPEGTVSSWISRARAALKRELGAPS